METKATSTSSFLETDVGRRTTDHPAFPVRASTLQDLQAAVKRAEWDRSAFIARHLDKPFEQMRAQTLAMEVVADHDGELRLVRADELRQAADADDFELARLRIPPLGDQRHLAVVVDEAEPYQPLVRDPLAVLHHGGVPEVDALLG